MVQGRMTVAKRTRMWNKAIIALMNHPTLASAAAAIGVCEDTIDNWLHQDDFKEQLRKAQDDALGHGIVKLNLRITETIDALHSIVMDLENPAAVRVAAASKELEIVTRTVAARAQAAEFERLTREIDELKESREEAEAQARASIIDGELLGGEYLPAEDQPTSSASASPKTQSKTKAKAKAKAKAQKAAGTSKKPGQRPRSNSGMAALVASTRSEAEPGEDQGS